VRKVSTAVTIVCCTSVIAYVQHQRSKQVQACPSRVAINYGLCCALSLQLSTTSSLCTQLKSMKPVHLSLSTSQREQTDLSATLCAEYMQLAGSTATACSHRRLVKPHTLVFSSHAKSSRCELFAARYISLSQYKCAT
jgi:hypothetical protein